MEVGDWPGDEKESLPLDAVNPVVCKKSDGTTIEQCGDKAEKERVAAKQLEISYKNRSGTWLSPIEQPWACIPKSPLLDGAPNDLQYRRYLLAAAENLGELVTEFIDCYGEDLLATYRRYPLEFRAKKPIRWSEPQELVRSLRNCPITVPVEIEPKTTTSSQSYDSNRNQITGSLRYTWQAELKLNQGRSISSDHFTFQVRHHTKLDASHENSRPVFCINIKSDDANLIDLRLCAILHIEAPFLVAAAKQFCKKGDHFDGQPVFDSLGRAWLDERIIRRAAFHYSQYQYELQESCLRNQKLYDQQEGLSEQIRWAHFLVHRSHLSELHFDEVAKSFKVRLVDLPKLPELKTRDFREFRK